MFMAGKSKLRVSAGAMLLSVLSAAPVLAADKTVAVSVLSIVEHPALDAVRDGVRGESEGGRHGRQT